MASQAWADEKEAMDDAARNNHLDSVKWMRENEFRGCTTSALDVAAGNHLEMVQWLHEHRSEGCTTAALDRVALWTWFSGCTSTNLKGDYCYGH